ncbi:MAG TPA: primosomal protein N' [Gammaproteobacteria bacterium]|nr:primosomal protein N' [Gammaproteobacteria bacterium]
MNGHEQDARVVDVALPVPLRQSYRYLVPTDMAALYPGMRVRVPFGHHQHIGLVTQTDRSLATGLKSVLECLDKKSIVDASLMTLLQWLATYYHTPIGEVMELALPVLLRRGKSTQPQAQSGCQLTPAGCTADPDTLTRAPRQRQLLQLLHAAGEHRLLAPVLCQHYPAWKIPARALAQRGLVERISALPEPVPAAPIRPPLTMLNPAQQQVVTSIRTAGSGYRAHVLDGVTGSGKTEVYLALTRDQLQQGRQVLLLVPEISLTPQLVERFQQQFDQRVQVTHSALSQAQRLQVWRLAQSGQAQVILGTRSAVFSPMPKLGLIVVDEEHDPSFKQQEGCLYHGRDVAVMRARILDIPVLLGSATPSLQSLANVRARRYQLHKLTKRAGMASLPGVQLLDISGLPTRDGITRPLLEAIARCLDRGEQCLLFLNRRGFAPVLLCGNCRWVAECRYCNARLTYHHARQQLHCHHCGARQTLPKHCPDCNSANLQPVGEGTERLQTTLEKQFPGQRVLRVDRDSVRHQGDFEQLREQITSGQAQILVGTQMLAKGHDFPNVTLVGIVNSDSSLYSVDYRATEQLAQQCIQVAGRAGRADKPGRVLIQTRFPEHPLFQAICQHDYAACADQLLEQRQQARFPPFMHFALLRADALQPELPNRFLGMAKELGSGILSGRSEQRVVLFDPAPAPMLRRASRYRMQLLAQSRQRGALQEFLRQWVQQLEKSKLGRKLRWSLDVDPVTLF